MSGRWGRGPSSGVRRNARTCPRLTRPRTASPHTLSAVALDILVPYWGDPDLMRETVESVFAQDRDDWRLLVVDDAYPDPQISEWLTATRRPTRHRGAARDQPRHHRELPRVPGARDAGARGLPRLRRRAAADYVGVVLDAFAAVPEAVMVQPGVRVVDETGTPSAGLADTVKQRLLRPRGDGRTVLSGEPLATSLLHGNWLYWPSIAFRRNAVEEIGFRVELPIIQDFALELDLVAHGGTLVVDPDGVLPLPPARRAAPRRRRWSTGRGSPTSGPTTRWRSSRCGRSAGPRRSGPPEPGSPHGRTPSACYPASLRDGSGAPPAGWFATPSPEADTAGGERNRCRAQRSAGRSTSRQLTTASGRRRERRQDVVGDQPEAVRTRIHEQLLHRERVDVDAVGDVVPPRHRG